MPEGTMGSYRSAASRRASDLYTLTAADRPMAVYAERDGAQVLISPEVKPEDWLAEGESVTYWAILPHGVITGMVTAGILPDGSFDAGASIRLRLRDGIVDWLVKDESGQPIPWEHTQADALLDGLPDAVHTFLVKHIGNGAPIRLAATDPETAVPDAKTGKKVGQTVGETSAGS